MATRGDSLKLSLLASASNNDGDARMSTIAGSSASPIKMSEFAATGSITGISGFTYVVEDTSDVYTLDFTGTGTRFDKVSSIADNFTWNVNSSGSYTGSSYISITGTPSSSCNISVGTMNPQDPSTQTELVTQKEHYISASFADGFNTQLTGYNQVFGKTIYSVDTYNSNTALCLTADTPVLLSDGTEIEIGDILEGDELVGYNIETLGDEDQDYLKWSSDSLSMVQEYVTVKNVTYSFSDRIYNFNNGELKTTHEHPLLVFDGIENDYRFKQAGKITIKDKLVKEDTTLTDVTSINIQKGESVEVVSIDVETQDTYVINGYINHNKGGNTHTDQDTILATTPALYLSPDTIDSDAVSAGDSLAGANIWEDSSGNNRDASIGSGTYQLNIGSIDGGRQVQWSAGGYLDLPLSADLTFTAGTHEFTLIWRLGDNIGTTTAGYPLAISDGGSTLRTGMFVTTGTVWGNLYVGGSTIAPSDTSINSNELYILVVQTSRVDMWKDGSKIVDNWTTFGTAAMPQANSWNVGSRTDGGYTINQPSWSMDVVAIIPKAITENERVNIENEFILN